MICLLLCACSEGSDDLPPLVAANSTASEVVTPFNNRAPVIESFEFSRVGGGELLYTDVGNLASMNGEIEFSYTVSDPDGGVPHVIVGYYFYRYGEHAVEVEQYNFFRGNLDLNSLNDVGAGILSFALVASDAFVRTVAIRDVAFHGYVSE